VENNDVLRYLTAIHLPLGRVIEDEVVLKPYTMIGYNIYTSSPYLLENLNYLYKMLWQGKKEYEHVAASVPDKALKRTILTLAQESNQYAHELSSQIQALGGSSPDETAIEVESLVDDKVFADENEIISYCKMNEKKMVKAYQEILNESFLYEGLRKMIRYQLNGILCAFMQLKLLNSVKFQ
jgi:uncharacterized protein (TIGR02284 family)